MMANGLITEKKEKEHLLGPMEQNIQETGCLTRFDTNFFLVSHSYFCSDTEKVC